MLPRLIILTVLLSTLWAACTSSDNSEPTAAPVSAPTNTATVTPDSTPALSPTASAVEESSLAGTSWRLVELVGEPVDPSFGATLEFEEDRLSGYSGCNAFGATFTASDSGDFVIGDFFTTDAGCPEPPHLMNFQERFYDTLRTSVRYFLDPPRLALHGANNATLLLFKPLADEARSTPTSSEVASEPTPTTPIAEYGNVEIYVMNADGSDQRRPDPSLAGEGWPSWMPDGRISFQSDRSGEERLYAVHPDGSGLEELPVDLRYITSRVQWSADGSQIYYASGIDGLEQLYVANADGSDPRRITEIAEGTSTPDWSSDGSKAVFTNRSHGPPTIYVVNTDGSDLQRITFEQEAADDSPVWSPDGSQIAFARYPNFGPGGIFIMNADGSDVRQLTQSKFSDNSPSWSPDGTQIAFVSNRDGGPPVLCSFTTISDYVWMESLDQMAWMSDQIVVGEVVEQLPSVFGPVEDRGGIEQTYPIYTDYLFAVDTWIRGDPSPTVRLRELGGSIGACVQTSEGEPGYEVGQRLLLFLQIDDNHPDLPPASIGLVGEQSFWAVSEDGAVVNATFPDFDDKPVDEMTEIIREIFHQPEPNYPGLVPLEDAPISEAD